MFKKILGVRNRRIGTKTGDAWGRLPKEYADGPKEARLVSRVSTKTRPEWFV